jgi:hypothetical protein
MQFSRVEARTTGELATEMVMAYELGPEAVIAFARGIGMMDELPRIAKLARAFSAVNAAWQSEVDAWQKILEEQEDSDNA